MKPINMKTWEVQALLDNRKTVTRRVVKRSVLERFVIDDNGELIGSLYSDDTECIVYPSVDDCQYQLSDILYVRETWNYGYVDSTDFEFQVNESFFEELVPGTMKDSFLFPRYFYHTEDLDGLLGMKWRTSIHMPRDAARIFLRVTDVRVDRLQDMNMNDIQSEGVVPDGVKGGQWQQWQHDYMKPAWDSTIKPKDRALYGWDANPWVWVVEFEKISKEMAENEA